MMLYDDSGLEPEADYDEEYTVGSSSSAISAPMYYPKPQGGSSNDIHQIETSSHKYSQLLEPTKTADRNKDSNIYQQFNPQIQQVFEEYEPQSLNGNQYIRPLHTRESRKQENSTRQQTIHIAETAMLAEPSTSNSSLSSSTSSDTNSATSVTQPTKMASLVANGVIPTFQVPTTRIPKKKKPDVEPSNILMEHGGVSSNVTPDSWQQMNALIKKSEANSDKLMELLTQCLQADVNMTLLTSNDTPKIVKKFSKSHQNPGVKHISAQCVAKWKGEITNPGNPKERMRKNVDNTSPPDSKLKKLEKRRLTEEGDKKKGNNTSSPIKDGDAGADAKKRKVDPTKKAEVKKIVPNKVQASSLGSGFMDALSSVEQTRKRPSVRRKPDPKVLTSDPLSVLDVMNMNEKKQQQSVFPADVRHKSPTPPAEEIPEKTNRKIKFADECGRNMVEIRYFEIEAGERINVNRLSPEEMKHHEAMMERRFKNESKHIEDEDEKEIPWRLLPLDPDTLSAIVRGCNSEAKVIEEKRQMSSLRAFCDPTEVFYITEDPEDFDPQAALPDPPIIPVYTEKELLLQKTQSAAQATVTTPIIIPAPKVEEKKALPNNLQNLLDGLKKQGIVGGGPGPATTSLSTLIPGLSSILGQANTQPAPAPTYSQAPIIQQQYQQVPQQQYVQQFPQQQYQHQFAPQPNLQANLAAIPSGQMPQRPANVGGMAKTGPLCHQFKNGNCRFGDRCRFSHDLNTAYTPRPRNEGFRGRGRPYDRNDRRDFHDRRNFREQRDYRERERDYPDRTPTDTTFSPDAQASSTIRFPNDVVSSSEAVAQIPADRVD